MLNPNFTGNDIYESFDRVIHEIYGFMLSNFHATDYVEIFVSSDGFKNGGFSPPLHQVRDLDERVIFDKFGLVIQSNENVELNDGRFKIEVYHVHLPDGGSQYSSKYLLNSFGQKFERVQLNSRALFNVPKDLDPFCGVTALILGLRLANGERLPSPYRINTRLMKRKCQSLLRRAGLPCIALNLEGVKSISKLSEYRCHPICVISREYYNTTIFNCNRDGKEDPIILYLNNNHYYLVRSVNTLLEKEGKLCLDCFTFCKNQVRNHKCDKGVCLDCKCLCSSDKTGKECLRCDSCFILFKSKECFDKHCTIGKSKKIPAKSSVCEKLVASRKCGKDLKTKNGISTGKDAYSLSSRVHECYKSKCVSCKKRVNLNHHLCFLQPIFPSSPTFKSRPL